MVKIITLIKVNYKIWIVFTLCILAPYLAVRILLPQVPYILYYYLTVLAAIKYIILDDKKYREDLRPKIQSYLYKELGKQPSKQQIINRIESMVLVRDLSLVVFAIFGILINIII